MGSTVSTIINEALVQFEQNKISYAVLRNYENYFVDLTSDLDLLIDQKHEELILDIIYNVASTYINYTSVKRDHKRTVVSLLIVEVLNEQTVETAFTFDLNKYLTLKLNALSGHINGLGLKVSINDLSLVSTTAPIPNQNFNTLSPDQDILFLLNHLLSKKKTKYLNKINNYLIKNDMGSIDSMSDNRITRYYMTKLFLESGIEPVWTNVFKNITLPFKFLKYKLFASKNTRVIYFSGPDGSGKTTTVDWASAYFKNLNIKYHRVKSLQVLTLLRLKNKYSRYDQEVLKYKLLPSVERDRDTGNRRWYFRRVIGLAVGLIEICIIGRIYIGVKRLQGFTLLVEESPYDIYVKRHRPEIKPLEYIFLPLLPQANISIICTASPDNIYSRKPELEIKETKDYYLKIGALYSKVKRQCTYNLHTDKSPDSTKSDLFDCISDIINKTMS